MFETLLAACQAELAALADAWLKTGATTFSVWSEGRQLARWPKQATQRGATLSAPIIINGSAIGEVRVLGPTDAGARARLVAEAGLLTHVLRTKQELYGVMTELADSQAHVRALYELTQSIRNHLTVENVLRCLASEAMRLIKARASFAVFFHDDGNPTLVSYGQPQLDEDTIWRFFWESSVSGEERSLTAAHDAAQLPPGVFNLLFVPIRLRDVIIAGLGLLDKTGSDFTSADKNLARAMAEQAGVQLERALAQDDAVERAKLRTEMDLARHIQHSLLTQRSPVVAGLDIFALSRPALELGGDFYDFVCQPGRPFMFSVGDITGKGLPAALLMTMTRTAIHGKARFMPNPQPETVLRNSNADLYDDLVHVGAFATAFVGQYDPAGRVVRYANAGHSPVIYRPFDGVPRLLQADNTALGIMPVHACKGQGVPLRPGDVLIVGTDGLSDARRSDDELFGNERLLHLVEGLADRSAREIADGMFDAVERFGAGRPQDDDETLVVIKGAAA